MQFKSLAFSLLAASLSVAQDSGNSTSGGNGSGNGSNLGALMAQLPSCAVPCFTSSAEKVGCSDVDFDCLCKTKSKEFVAAITPCATSNSDCSLNDLLNAQKSANDFCAGVRNDPSDSQLQQATQVASSVFAEVASPTSTPDAAARPAIGLGFAGAAVVAAMAL